MRFARAVLSRPYIFTIVFLIANIFVFLLMWSSSGMQNSALWEFPNSVLVAYGAKLNRLINQDHQWWRFVTPIFVHGGIIHLFFNMYGLWILGPYVERLYGSAKFVVFWVVTGAAGVLGSYLTMREGMHTTLLTRFLFKSQDMPSVGASGALFGLIGVLFVFGIKFRHELPEGFKRAFGTGMMPTILINLFIGFAIPVIDNAAHLGGLVAGAALALVVDYKRPGRLASVAIFWHVLQIAALALVAISFYEVARHYGETPPSLRNGAPESLLPSHGASDAVDFLNAINQAQRAFVRAVNEQDKSGLESALKALEAAPSPDEKAQALKNELKSLLERAGNLGAQGPRTGTRALAQERSKLAADWNAWQRKFEQWVKTDGSNYGLFLEEEQNKQSPPDSKTQNSNTKR